MVLRRSLLLLLALVVIGVAASLPSLLRRRIEIGMTEAQAEEVMGTPSSRVPFKSEDQLRRFCGSMQWPCPPGAYVIRWDWSGQAVRVLFDHDHRVVAIHDPTYRLGQFLDRVVHALRLR